MRALVVLTIMVIFSVLRLAAVEPLTEIEWEHLLAGLALASVYAFIEVLFLRRKALGEASAEKSKSTIALTTGVQSSPNERGDQARTAALEEERNVLQDKLTEATLVAQEREEELERTREDLRRARVEAARATADRPVAPELVGILTLFQEKGRLVDFLLDDITPYDDQRVGAVARVVHQGCREVLKEHFDIVAAHAGKEGDTISLEAGYDTNTWRLVGDVRPNPPYRGRVLHRGWKVNKVSLPRITNTDGEAGRILVPAELEVKE